MPALTVVNTDLLKKLQPAAAATRASYSRMRRPWTPGYRALAAADDAAVVAGFNSYHPGDNAHVALVPGIGAADAVAPFTYDLPATTPPTLVPPLAQIVLPTTTPLTDAIDYLDAVCIVYAPYDRDNAILLERIATGGADVTRPFWRVDDADTFTIAYGYDAASVGTEYIDVPNGWWIEIQVPTATDLSELWAPTAADSTILSVTDFMAAGNTAQTGNVILDRVFR